MSPDPTGLPEADRRTVLKVLGAGAVFGGATQSVAAQEQNFEISVPDELEVEPGESATFEMSVTQLASTPDPDSGDVTELHGVVGFQTCPSDVVGADEIDCTPPSWTEYEIAEHSEEEGEWNSSSTGGEWRWTSPDDITEGDTRSFSVTIEVPEDAASGSHEVFVICWSYPAGPRILPQPQLDEQASVTVSVGESDESGDEEADDEVSLQLTDIHPVQATANTYLKNSNSEIQAPAYPDLVAFKETGIIFDLEGDTEALADDETVTFELRQWLEDGTSLTESFELPNDNITPLVGDYDVPPIDVLRDVAPIFHEDTVLRDTVESLEVDITETSADVELDGDTAAITIGENIDVVDIGQIEIGFIEIKDPDDGENYGNPTNGRLHSKTESTPRERFMDLVKNAVDYISKTFPVSNASPLVYPEAIDGTSSSGDHHNDLEKARETLENHFSDINLDITVAIVPDSEDEEDDWFSFHGADDTVGLHPSGPFARAFFLGPSQPETSVAVEANLSGFEDTVAHEIGHHFIGSDYPCTEQRDTGIYPDEMAARRTNDEMDCPLGLEDRIDNSHARTPQDIDNSSLVSTSFDLSGGVLQVPSHEAPSLMQKENRSDNWTDTFFYQTLIDNRLRPYPSEN